MGRETDNKVIEIIKEEEEKEEQNEGIHEENTEETDSESHQAERAKANFMKHIVENSVPTRIYDLYSDDRLSD